MKKLFRTKKKLTLVVVISVILLLASGVAGIMYYQQYKETSKQRAYDDALEEVTESEDFRYRGLIDANLGADFLAACWSGDPVASKIYIDEIEAAGDDLSIQLGMANDFLRVAGRCGDSGVSLEAARFRYKLNMDEDGAVALINALLDDGKRDEAGRVAKKAQDSGVLQGDILDNIDSKIKDGITSSERNE